MFKESLLIILLGCGLASINSLDICEDEEDGARLAHPTDCSKFIECENGKTAAIRYCPHGLHFNRYEAICDYKFRAGCDYSYALQLLSSENDDEFSDFECEACKAKCSNFGQPNQKPKPPIKPHVTDANPTVRPSTPCASTPKPTPPPKPITTPCATKPSSKPTTTPCATKPSSKPTSTPCATKPSTKPTTPCATKPSSKPATTPCATKPSSKPTTTPCHTPTAPTPEPTTTPCATKPSPKPTPTPCATKPSPKPTKTPCNTPTAPTPEPTPSKPTATPCVTKSSSKPTTTPCFSSKPTTTPCVTKPSTKPPHTPCASKTSKPSKTYSGRIGAARQLPHSASDQPTSVRLCENPGQCATQKDGTLFEDPLSNGFIVCHNQCEVKMACPTGLVYNPKVKVCDWPKA